MAIQWHRSHMGALAAMVSWCSGVQAQTFTVLHDFGGGPDGAGTFAGLVLAGGTLYGTTRQGGTNGTGVVFCVGTDGTGYRILHDFSVDPNGGSPEGGLVLAGNTLYGATSGGGANGPWGTVFSLNTDGGDYTVVHSFDSTGSSHPHSRLWLSGGTLYGSAAGAANPGWASVFAVGIDGSGFDTIYSFSTPSGNPLVNADGEQPQGAVTLSGGTLFGTAYGGGPYGSGTVYCLATNGTPFQVLHAFAGTPDGGYP